FDTRRIVALALAVEREGVRAVLLIPEVALKILLLALELVVQFAHQIAVPGKLRQTRKCAHGLGAQAALIKLSAHRQQRAAFYPSMYDILIERVMLRVPGAAQE